MPQAVIAAGKLVVGLLTATGVTGFIARVAGTILLSTLTSQLFGPKIADRGFSRVQITTRSALEYHKIIYGQAMVSGPIVYNNLSGTDGENLWYVIALAGHEVEDFTSVWLDGDEILKADIAWTAGSAGADGTGTGNVTTAKWVGDSSETALRVFYYLGHANQVATAKLTTPFSEWGSNNRLRGVAYVVFELIYVPNNEKVWEPGIPRAFKALVKGRKIYDPAKDSTQTTLSPAGSGAHRYTDSTTWEYSTNPALCVADYLMTYKGVAPATDINWQSVLDAAIACDVSVTIPVSSTENRFTCNGVLSTGQSHRRNLEALLSSMDGKLSWSNGQWKVRAAVWEASSVSLTVDDLAGEVEVRGSSPHSERFNTVRGFYADPTRKYQFVEFQHTTASEFTTRDNGEVIEFDLELPCTNSEYMAQRIAYRNLEQGDNQVIAKLVLNAVGAKIAIGDVVDLTLSELSWSAKTFRVIEWAKKPDGTYTVTVREDASASYTDPLEGEYTVKTSSGGVTIPAIITAPPSALTATAVSDGVELNWTNPAARLFETIEVHASDDNDRTNASLVAAVNTNKYTEILKEAPRTRYYWIRAISFDDRISAWHPVSSTAGVSGVAAPVSVNILADPDFDLSTGFDEYWEDDSDNQGTGSVLSTATFSSGTGANSSNAVDLKRGDYSTVNRAEIENIRRFRHNYGAFIFRIRYKTTQNTIGGDIDNAEASVLGYSVATGGSVIYSVTQVFVLPASYNVWRTISVVLNFDANDSVQFIKFAVAIGNSGTGEADNVRVDSVFVTPTDINAYRKSISIENPDASEDVSWFFTDKAIRITRVKAVLRGSSTPSVTWTIRFDTDRSATGTELATGGETTTSVTSGTFYGESTFDDNTIPANSFVWVETTAQSGTVNELLLNIEFAPDE